MGIQKRNTRVYFWHVNWREPFSVCVALVQLALGLKYWNVTHVTLWHSGLHCDSTLNGFYWLQCDPGYIEAHCSGRKHTVIELRRSWIYDCFNPVTIASCVNSLLGLPHRMTCAEQVGVALGIPGLRGCHLPAQLLERMLLLNH